MKRPLQLFKSLIKKSYFAILHSISPRLARRLLPCVPFLRPYHHLPKFIVDELKFLATIEAKLSPDFYTLVSITQEKIPNASLVGKVYAQCYQICSQAQFDFLVLTDLTNFQTQSSHQKTLILLTAKAAPELLNFPEHTVIVEIWKLLQTLEPDDQELVLARLILQLGIPKVNFASSGLGSDTFKKYAKALLKLTQ